jgi:hypothetical protein
MNTDHFIYALRWLVRDTFRQALAGRVFWIMLGASALCIVFCLGVSVTPGVVRDENELFNVDGRPAGAGVTPGELRLFFGFMTANIGRDAEDAVHGLEVIFASWVAGTVGLLLTLVWTASFLPEFLQPNSATVLLAKPLPRGVFLLGKVLGVVAFVAMQALVFFLGTWVALGVRTGVWHTHYLAGWPILVLQFAVFYTFSALIAATWRSAVACVLGVILFWALCMGVNYGRYVVLSLPHIAPETRRLSSVTSAMAETGYWLLPKPADDLLLLEEALDAGAVMGTIRSLPEIAPSLAHFHPWLSLASSLAFAGVMILLGGAQLAKLEY